MFHVHFHLWNILSFVLSFAVPFLFNTGILSQLFRLLYFLFLWSFYLSFALLCTLLLLFDLYVTLSFHHIVTFIFWALSLLIQMALSVGLAYMHAALFCVPGCHACQNFAWFRQIIAEAPPLCTVHSSTLLAWLW
jgi:hypothetical protein